MGYPITGTKPTKQDLQFILDNFKNRLAGWKTNTLSTAGRALLVRTTLNALPTHLMQMIQLPNEILNKMEQFEPNFYWGSTLHRKILVNWATVTRPKDSGGLGIQDLHIKNKVILASTAW